MIINRRRLSRFVVGIFLTAALVMVSGCGKDEDQISERQKEISHSAQGAVLVLDGEAVSEEEYGMLAQEYQNQISMKYSTEQINREDFWETEIDGAAPWESLAELVEEELKYNYTIRALAVEEGLAEDYSYDELMESMNQENDARSDSADEEVTYGLSSFDESTYYKYWYSNLEIQVMNELITDSVSDQDCRAYYEDHPEQFTYDVGVTILYGELGEDTAENRSLAENVCGALLNGQDAGEIEESLGVSLTELELSSFDTQGGMSGIYENRWLLASGLAEDEVYGPYEDNGCLCVMKCLNRQENGQIAYESVKSQIERYLQLQGAQQKIAERQQNMEVSSGGISEKEAILKALAQ